jgi:hypothetical protein
MRNYLFIVLTFLSISGCSQKPSEILEETNYESKSPNLEIVLKSYELSSNFVENIFKNDKSKIELYIQLEENGTIERVPNFNETPELYFSAYNLIRDEDGNIIYIAEFPMSESEDYNLSYKNYFDKKGNIIAFERRCNSFNGGCAEIIREESKYFYDDSHQLIKKTYRITDGDNKEIDYKNCVFNYRFKYKQRMTINEYMKKYKFKS